MSASSMSFHSFQSSIYISWRARWMEKGAEGEEEWVWQATWARWRKWVWHSAVWRHLTEANGAPWSPTSTQRRNPDHDDLCEMVWTVPLSRHCWSFYLFKLVLRGSVAQWLARRTHDSAVVGSLMLQLPWESNLPTFPQRTRLQNGYPAIGSCNVFIISHQRLTGCYTELL